MKGSSSLHIWESCAGWTISSKSFWGCFFFFFYGHKYYLVKPTTARITALGIFLSCPTRMSKSKSGILDHSSMLTFQPLSYSQVCTCGLPSSIQTRVLTAVKSGHLDSRWNTNFVFLQPFLCWFGCIFRLMILLKHAIMAKSTSRFWTLIS